MGQTAIDGVEGLNRAGELGKFGGFSGSRQLMWGHALLLVCAVLYLIWWCIFFRLNAQVKGGALRVFGIACILVAAVAGIAGIVLECFGISKLPALPTLSAAAGRARSVWIWPFAVGGVAANARLHRRHRAADCRGGVFCDRCGFACVSPFHSNQQDEAAVTPAAESLSYLSTRPISSLSAYRLGYFAMTSLASTLAWSSPKTLRYCSIHMATNRYSLRFPCCRS